MYQKIVMETEMREEFSEFCNKYKHDIFEYGMDYNWLRKTWHTTIRVKDFYRHLFALKDNAIKMLAIQTPDDIGSAFWNVRIAALKNIIEKNDTNETLTMILHMTGYGDQSEKRSDDEAANSKEGE